MEKTTVYLPQRLKTAVTRAAKRRGVSEARVIRDSIEAAVGADRPRPRGGLFAAEPMAGRIDELLAEEGFGEQ
jgi:hypothetical protein